MLPQCVFIFFFFYHCARMLGVLSAQHLSYNSAGKLTVFVETNDRSCVLCHYFPFMNGRKREVCFVTLRNVAFVPTVAASGNVKRTKKNEYYVCASVHVGELIVLQINVSTGN